MSRIHALQNSTTSPKLLESVRFLRPLFCESLRASGCDTTGIDEQDPILLHVDQSLQKGDIVQGLLNSHTSGLAQHCVGVHAQFGHVREELANLIQYHAILPSDGHIHDLDVNAEYGHHRHMHVEEYLHAQHCNPRHVAHQSQNHANGGDAVQSLANVQHHRHGQYYQDAPNPGSGKYLNTEYGDAPLHYLYHGQYGYHGDAHYYEHGRNANSMFVSSESFPLNTVDCSPELMDMQKNPEQMSFRHSFLTTVEPSIDIDPYSPLLCTHYPDNHGLKYRRIHTYYNHSLQQQFPSETMAFVNSVPLEAPGCIIDGTLTGAEATSKISDNMYECMRAHDLARSCMNNFHVHEVHTGHQEVPSLPAEGVKLSSLKGEATTSTINLLCERRRRKRRNEGPYALGALVPVLSKVDNLENNISEEDLVRSRWGSFSCAGQEMRSCKDISLKYKIFEVDVRVMDMEQQTYHLCIHCVREDGVLLELTKALEALNLDILNASIGPTHGTQVAYTAVVKVDAAEFCTPHVLKERILRSATMYGFIIL